MTKETGPQAPFEAVLHLFNENLARIDQLASITLKGHLLLESKLDSIISQHVFNADRVETMRLQFRQKVELCKGFGLRKDKLPIWSYWRQLAPSETRLLTRLIPVGMPPRWPGSKAFTRGRYPIQISRQRKDLQ